MHLATKSIILIIAILIYTSCLWADNSVQTIQPATRLDPPGYIENTLPEQINLNLIVNGRTYTNPNAELLETLYGDNYKSSVYYRTKEALTKDTELRRHYQLLQSTRGHDITVKVHYDNPADLIAGETLTHFDKEKMKFVTVTVEEGDTIDTLASKLGIGREEVEALLPRRLNVHPHARWSTGEVNIGESWRNYPNETLYETLAHEAAHTADGTCHFPFNYGNDRVHYVSEVTDRRTAWIEGWAQYNGGLFSPNHRAQINDATHTMEQESPDSSKDDQIYEQLSNPHFMTRLRNEGTVGAILLNIDGNGKYRNQLMETFRNQNINWRTQSLKDRDIVSFTNDYMYSNPEQAKRTLLAIDCATHFRADDERLKKLYGPLVNEYLKERQELRKKYFENWGKSNFETFELLENEEDDEVLEPLALLGESTN